MLPPTLFDHLSREIILPVDLEGLYIYISLYDWCVRQIKSSYTHRHYEIIPTHNNKNVQNKMEGWWVFQGSSSTSYSCRHVWPILCWEMALNPRTTTKCSSTIYIDTITKTHILIKYILSMGCDDFYCRLQFKLYHVHF